MKDEAKGQVSIEFIFVVGAILTMAIVLIPFGLKNAEMTKGLSAARDGGTQGAAMRGLGFSSDGGNEGGTIRILNITPEYDSMVGDLEWYKLRFYVSAPSDLQTTSICTTVETEAIKYLNYAFTGNWDTSSPVDGSYYRFTTVCNFV
jgi:hypothetical protein